MAVGEFIVQSTLVMRRQRRKANSIGKSIRAKRKEEHHVSNMYRHVNCWRKCTHQTVMCRCTRRFWVMARRIEKIPKIRTDAE